MLGLENGGGRKRTGSILEALKKRKFIAHFFIKKYPMDRGTPAPLSPIQEGDFWKVIL